MKDHIEAIIALLANPISLAGSGDWDADVECMRMKIFWDADRQKLREFLALALPAYKLLPQNGKFSITGQINLEPKFYDTEDCEIEKPSDWVDEHTDEEHLVDELTSGYWHVKLEERRLVFSYLRDNDNAEVWAALLLPEAGK